MTCWLHDRPSLWLPHNSPRRRLTLEFESPLGSSKIGALICRHTSSGPFGQKLMPILSETGIELSGDPEVFAIGARANCTFAIVRPPGAIAQPLGQMG